jgi:cell division septation protein DedD
VRAAADRGEPRAQYLLGVAYFNGDSVPKDWVRAYALTSLAQQSGVDQAKAALAQMDRYIPLEQRQQAAALAPALSSQAQATRARQLAAADLGARPPRNDPAAVAVGGTAALPSSTAGPSTTATAVDAAAVARVAADNSPRNAGADYARPIPSVAGVPASVAPAATALAAPSPRAAPVYPAAAPRPTSVPAASTAAAGPWRLQLGAFSVAANASGLWARVKDRSELAGHPRQTASAGRLTKLFAGGFASREAAQSACSRLGAAGFTCLVTRN